MVFISYSSKDLALANKICHFLESNGIQCWIAPRNIAPGMAYPNAIMRGIKSSDTFLLVVTSNSIHSAHVNNETDIAFNLGKRIIPIKVEDAPLGDSMTYYLARKQWIVANHNLEAGLQNLLHVLRNYYPAPAPCPNPIPSPAPNPTPSPLPSPEKSHSKRKKITLLIILGIVINIIIIGVLLSLDDNKPIAKNDQDYSEEIVAVEEIVDTTNYLQGTLLGTVNTENYLLGYQLQIGNSGINFASTLATIENNEIKLKYEQSYWNRINKRSLTVYFDDGDGKSVGSFEGLIFLHENYLVYEGEARSWDDSNIFPEGEYRFVKEISNEEREYLLNIGILQK